MLRKGLIIAVAVLFLLGAMVGCAAELEQPTADTSVDLALSDGVTVELEQAAKETNTFTLKGRVIVDAYHYDAATGTYIPFYHHEGHNDLVTLGLNWIETQLGDTGTTETAHWISLSDSTDSVLATWEAIPGEITDADLARAAGTYSTTGGNGAWEIENTFNATATHTNVQLTGLQWGDIGTNNLMAANTFTAVTLNDGDILTITWQLSVS